MNWKLFLVGAAFFVASISPLCGQDNGALIDILVRKGILTDQEAEEVRAELTQEAATTSAGKMKLASPITEFEIYGDARVRYEIRNGDGGFPSSVAGDDTIQRNRHRYRLRLGIRGKLMDDWFWGLRMETSASARSTNVTFGDDSGPFGKSSDSVYVGQAYLGYTGFKDIKLTAGRMANPFVTTPMVWDGDINPEGLSQQWKHTYTFSWGGGSSSEAAAASSGKDGKMVYESTAEVSLPQTMSVELFANFGQFIYDDQNPENPLGPNPIANGREVPENDAYLFGYQVGAKWNISKTTYVQVAPTIYHYSGYGNDFNTLFRGGPIPPSSSNQTGINSLFVFNMPWEFGWSWGELPFRIFGDVAVNLDAEDRAEAAGFPEEDDERWAYQIGLQVGKIKEAGDWQLAVFWQHTDQYSLDPNLVDSDIFDSRVNMEGIALQAGYALSDAVVFNLTYAYGMQAEGDLGTGGSGDIGFNPLDHYQLFQADLNVKF